MRWALPALALAASLCARSRAYDCLPEEAVPRENRQNITIAGNTTHVKIGHGCWPSSHLLAEIMAIILKEVMGYNAELTDVCVPGSEQGFLAMADCRNYDVEDCDPGPPGHNGHLFFELWEMYADTTRTRALAAFPERVPVYVGYPEGLGYFGSESLFVAGDIVHRALATSQTPLQWYQMYNDSWSRAAHFFSDHTTLPTPSLNCTDVPMITGAYLSTYLQVTGDAEAATVEDGAVVPNCDEGWMLSKTCRDRVAAGLGCIPVVALHGWGFASFHQLSYFYDMPLALGPFTRSDWLQIGRTLPVLFYWWLPDTAMIEQDAVEIQFPPANIDEQRLGIFRTMVEGQKTLRVAHAAVPEDEPILEQLLKNTRLGIQTVQAMIRPYPTGAPPATIACEWLQANEAVWRRWVPDLTSCFPGQGLALDPLLGRPTCTWCGPGTRSERDRGPNRTFRRCFECPAGRSQPLPGSQECPRCESGRFSDANASTECADCLIGSYASTPGMSVCTPCREGEITFQLFANTRGVSSWTPVRGAQNSSLCGCDVGMRLDGVDTGDCVACGVGLDCRGMNQIFIEPGYYSPDDKLSIFSCFTDPNRCPGGAFGTELCNVGREGLLCARCKEGHTTGPNGTCIKCKGKHFAPFVVVCVLAFIGLLVLYKVIDSTNLANRSKAIAVLTCLSSMLTLFVQQLGVMGKMSVSFSEPFATIMRIAAFFNFDFAILQLGCIQPQINAVREYTIQIAAVFILGIAVCLIHVANVVIWHRGAFAKRTFSLIGSLGTMLLIFLTAMMNSAVMPYKCQKHPNGLKTVRVYPWTMCFEEEHISMLVFSVPYLCLPLSFVVFIAFVVYRFPWAMSQGNVGFLRNYSFLFRRFGPGEYWYIFFFVVRNTILGVSPALPDILLQVLTNTTTLTISYGLVTKYSPWVVSYANYCDIVIHLALIILMSLIGFYAEISNPGIIGVCATGFVVVVLLSFSAVGGYTLIRYVFYRKQKEWKYFLCHHKAGAGAFARLLKVQLLEYHQSMSSNRVKVWLDCDDLTNLEKLFEYVTESSYVVALLSKELFLRPWCMGELVTATLKNVPLIPIRFSDFAPLTEEFIEAYEDHVDISCLAPYAITIGLVQDMLEGVRTQPQIILPASLSIDGVKAIAVTIASKYCGKDLLLEDPKRKTPTDATVVALADHTNLECVATALVLIKYLQRELTDFSMIPFCLGHGDEMPFDAKVSIVILTNGAFSEPHFVRLLLGTVGKRYIPIIAEDGFRFPAQAMLDDIRATAATKLLPYGVDADPDDIVHVIANVFKEIAVVFSPQDYSSNDQLLKTKAKAITARLSETKLKVLQKTRSEASRPSSNHQSTFVSDEGSTFIC